MRGTIKRIVTDKGYGFVRGADGNERFFHRSGVTAGSFEDLKEGDKVDFEEEVSPKGPRATDIRHVRG